MPFSVGAIASYLGYRPRVDYYLAVVVAKLALSVTRGKTRDRISIDPEFAANGCELRVAAKDCIDACGMHF
jgi:hypothetical protein